MKRQAIADALGVSLSQVKRWLEVLPIPERASQDHRKRLAADSVRERPRYADIQEDGLSKMQKAKIILGNRMGENHVGYTLDGRPASSMQIARAANLT